MPISVDAAHRGKIDGHEVKVEYSNVIGPMVCDTTCKYMFPLDPKLVFILNASEKVRILSPPPERKASNKNYKDKKRKSYTPTNASELQIIGRGFSECLGESTKEW